MKSKDRKLDYARVLRYFIIIFALLLLNSKTSIELDIEYNNN